MFIEKQWDDSHSTPNGVACGYEHPFSINMQSHSGLVSQLNTKVL